MMMNKQRFVYERILKDYKTGHIKEKELINFHLEEFIRMAFLLFQIRSLVSPPMGWETLISRWTTGDVNLRSVVNISHATFTPSMCHNLQWKHRFFQASSRSCWNNVPVYSSFSKAFSIFRSNSFFSNSLLVIILALSRQIF